MKAGDLLTHWEDVEAIADVCAEDFERQRRKRTTPTADAPIPLRACELFNRLAEPVPVTLSAQWTRGFGRLVTWLAFGVDHPRMESIRLLWFFLQNTARHRLKRCGYAKCRRWFVDRTSNLSGRRCSPSCTARSWNRPARRQAGHRQYQRQARRS